MINSKSYLSILGCLINNFANRITHLLMIIYVDFESLTNLQTRSLPPRLDLELETITNYPEISVRDRHVSSY